MISHWEGEWKLPECFFTLIIKYSIEIIEMSNKNGHEGSLLIKFPRTSHIHDLGAMASVILEIESDSISDETSSLRLLTSPHLALPLLTTSQTRDDLVLGKGEASALISNPSLTIEEKVDGANLGISLIDGEIRFQKRGHWVVPASEEQFAKLESWASQHKHAILRILANGNRILFGEWLSSQHSVHYDSLPDWFLAFDVYEISTASFLSVTRRDELLKGSGINAVRTVHKGPMASMDQLVDLVLNLETLYCRKGVSAEGVYLRVDEEGKLKRRAKLVHPSFRQTIEDDGHWSAKRIVHNVVRPDLWVVDDDEEEEEREEEHLEVKEKSSTRILFKQGVICAVGEGIEVIAEIQSQEVPEKARQQREVSRGHHHHLTLIKPEEVETLIKSGNWASGKDLAQHVESQVDLDGWLSLGLGSCSLDGSSSFFSVIVWPSSETIRVSLGLRPVSHDFHVTLGYFKTDVHGVNKSCSTLMHPPAPLTKNQAAILALSVLNGGEPSRDAWLYVKLIDECMATTMATTAKDEDEEMVQCWRIIKAKRSGKEGDYEGCLTLLGADEAGQKSSLSHISSQLRGKAYWGLGQYEQSSHAFQASLDASVSLGQRDDVASSPSVRRLFVELRKSWNRDASIQALAACRRKIQAINSPQGAVVIPDVSINTRDRFDVEILSANGLMETVTLPRNTSWLVKGQVLGSSTPTSRDQILAFGQKLDVALVVTLTEEGPLPASWFEGTGVRNLLVPVPNYDPPTIDQMDLILSKMEQCIKNEKRSVLVHCGGGKGRAGTVLACYLLKHGLLDLSTSSEEDPSFIHLPEMTADEAIRAIRRLRPGSIETDRQEKFMSTFSASLWQASNKALDNDNRASSAAADLEAPPKAGPSEKGAQRDKGASNKLPRLIMLVGLPGSGKSTFASALTASNEAFVRISQDECRGSRRDCEGEFHMAIQKQRKGSSGHRCVILDRCNSTKEDRKQWLDLLSDSGPSSQKEEGKTKRGVVAVFFDLEPRTCIERIMQREGHPTLPPERGAKAVASFSKSLEPPLPLEGFQRVHHIKSEDEADLLLESFTL